ncbi:M56 family metallopeptidase [Paraclostridium ghonii]|uniref:M56 family metallopeptidase n=1 Tax=Paraclostridium ghonii TaxID=29358 RepID=UPI00202D06CE|nr:M56 family metallopeptidase [Paeniclostridium ghonii]MCM0168071.1 M56 family metallopeptidase [Paeniclostridium ghonii]
MSYTIFDILKTSIYISMPIILIVLLKDRILNKYTYKLNYIFCILITLRMFFISNIKIYLPFNPLSISNHETLKTVYYTTNEHISPLDYTQIFFVIWLCGAIYVIAKNTYMQIVFYKKIRNITYKATDSNTTNLFKEEKEALSIKKDIELLKVDGISSPALINVFNSKVVLPNKEYDETQLKWIFRHELIHYKRKDNILKFLLMIACAIHWFNPLLKYFKLYFYEQCELSCDEKVLEKSSINDKKEYALVLLNTLKYRNKLKSNMLYSHFNTSHNNLIKRRVEGMMNLKKRKKGIFITICVCTISALSVLSFNIKSNQNSVYANEESSKKVQQAELNEEANIKPKASNKIITEEEIKKNLENVKEEDMKELMEFYPDRKFDELTQAEVDYALDFLFTGKCKKVNIGSDSTFSINLENLYKDEK